MKCKCQCKAEAVECGLLPLQSAEKCAMKRALEECGWNLTHAAKKLGISWPTMHAKACRYGLWPHNP